MNYILSRDKKPKSQLIKLILVVIVSLSSSNLFSQIFPVLYSSQNRGVGLAKARNQLFFVNNDAIYKSDGVNPPQLVKSFGYSVPSVLGCLGTDSAYYVMTGYSSGPQYIYQTWKCDGTGTGTVVLQSGPITPHRGLIQVKDSVFFTGNNGNLYLIRPDNSLYLVGTGEGLFEYQNQLLYKSNSSTLILFDPISKSNTTLVSQTSSMEDVMLFHDTIYFENYQNLYFIDPLNHNLQHADSTMLWINRVVGHSNNQVVVSACLQNSNSILDYELYVLDQSNMTFSLLKDIKSGPNSSAPNQFMQAENKVFFFANDSVHNRELWVTDGTISGTKLVVDLSDSTDSFFESNIVPELFHNYYLRGDTIHLSITYIRNGIDSSAYIVTNGDFVWKINVTNTKHQDVTYWQEFNNKVYVHISHNYQIGGIFMFDGNIISSTNSKFSEQHAGIFPNPVKNDLNLISEIFPSDLQILNLQGQIVKTCKITNPSSPSINVSDLESGNYFVNFFNKSNRITLRFIKE